VFFCGGKGRGDLLCNSDGGTRIEWPAAANAFICGFDCNSTSREIKIA